MLNLAIAVDIDRNGDSVIETNTGDILAAPSWPQDCEFQIVSYRKGSRTARIVYHDALSEDIGHALDVIARGGFLGRSKPDWFVRLQEAATTW
jgi:hypothetical protein